MTADRLIRAETLFHAALELDPEKRAEYLGDACDDPDGDGVFDLGDNCPDDYDPTQANGDGDSLGDLCDPYPAHDLRVRPEGPSLGWTDAPVTMATWPAKSISCCNLFNLSPDAQRVPAPYLCDFLNGITTPDELSRNVVGLAGIPPPIQTEAMVHKV